MHSQEPQIHQVYDSFWNDAPVDVNNEYEPCGNYLCREKSKAQAFRLLDYGEPFPCDLDLVKVLTLFLLVFCKSCMLVQCKCGSF